MERRIVSRAVLLTASAALMAAICGCNVVPGTGTGTSDGGSGSGGGGIQSAPPIPPPPPTPAPGTFNETFATGSAGCWEGGPSSCTQTWANKSGTPSTQSIVDAPGTGWDQTKVIEIPASSTPLFVYSMGTIPYIPPGAAVGDVTVEFSYDSTNFPGQAILLLTSGIDNQPAYALNLDGTGNCELGGKYWIPCSPNHRHLLHVHLDGTSSYDQIDGGTQYPFTANSVDPITEVALQGSTGANLYFGDISIKLSGFNSCLARPQMFFDGAGGNGTVTTANLDAGTHGGNTSSGWEMQPLNGVSFSYESGGSPLPQPVSVCGSSFSGDSGNLVRMTLGASAGSSGYWDYGILTSHPGFSVGFAWSYTSTGLNNYVDFFGIGDNNGAIAIVQLDSVGGAQQICLENVSNDSLPPPCIPVDVTPSTPYWITFGTSPTSDNVVYLYSYPDMKFLGGAQMTPNARPATAGLMVVKLGKSGSEPVAHDMTMDYWNVMTDVSDGVLPLMPQ